MKPLILASESPFRKAVLQKLGFEFSTQKPKIDERDLEQKFGGPLTDLAEYLSHAKAASVFKEQPQSLVIGSDQVLVFQGQSFPKPKNLEEASERLSKMQGQTHELHTGLCVLSDKEIFKHTEVTRLKMHSLSPGEIKNYVALDQPIGCAGGYKIEERGLLLFEKIETQDHNSIIGLPTLSLVSILRRWGISRL